jgi:hypothetical protein
MSVTKQVVHTIAFFVLGWNLFLADLLACEHALFEDSFHVLNPMLKRGVMILQKTEVPETERRQGKVYGP